MIIYEEIVFDANGNVIYEDSYEYSGDVMLLKKSDTQKEEEDRLKIGYTGLDINIDLGYPSASNSWISENQIQTLRDLKEESARRAEVERLRQESQAQIAAERDLQIDMQINSPPMPSLPSISNIGTTSFTGVVNQSAVPGGFQPLPQIGGKGKKLYQLSKFHGGINKKSSPRDIADFECQEAKNMTFSNVGLIKPLGDIQNANAIGADISANGIQEGFSGYGLFQFTAPADHDGGTVGEHVFTCVADGDAVSIYEGTNGIDGDWITHLGTTDDTNVCQIYYAAGNGLYVADANFAHGNVSKAKVYVNRSDINGTVPVSGWKQGNPLINSPTFHASNTDAVEWKGSHGNAGDTGRLEVAAYETSDDGSWNGTYYFYVSWLFDNGCETGLTAIGSDAFADKTCDFNVSIQHTNTNPLGGDKRIEGAKVYFKESGTTERFLLAEIRLIDGVRGAFDTTYIPWHNPTGTVYDLASEITFTAPPSVYTYLSENTYYANEVYTQSPDATGTTPTPIAVRYKTATVSQNGIVFIGNVMFDEEHMPDAMIFSMLNRPGLFPKYNIVDSPSSDGSPITALASFQDTILQFKQNSLYIINISNPSTFFAESVFRDCGVFNPCQVFTTAFGVIFANKFGCYIYDGEKVISLTGGKFDWLNQSGITEATANASDASFPCVGYDPRSQSIIVLKDIGDDANVDDGWVYNLQTQSWSEGIDMIANGDNTRHTNFIITNDGYLAIKRGDDGTLLNYNHDKSVDTGDQTITYITKDIDFGFPSQTKKIMKVYVTYYSDDSTVPTLTFGVDGDTTPTEGFDNGSFASSGGLQTTAFTVNDTALTGIKSLSLKISGATDHSFEINDISILYRLRPIK